MTANLDQLSHAELLERLALTLERSRKRRTDELHLAKAEALEAPEAAEAAEAAEIDVSTGDELGDDAAEQLDAPDLASAAHEAPDEEPTAAEEPCYRIPQPPVPVIPAALRPIAFDDDLDADLLPSIVPPRHFSLAPAASNPPPEGENGRFAQATGSDGDEQPHLAPCASATDEASAPEAADGVSDDEKTEEERELEEGYSSLLSLSRPDRPQFVRVEEPEDDGGEIKPFVVFPAERTADSGPFARPAASDFRRPEVNAAEEVLPEPESAGEERRFDGPGDARPEAIDPSKAASDHDSEEMERSLKAALASLQRMSGAA